MLHLDEGILSALLDGELSGAEQLEVEAHLRGCGECRDRLAELKDFMRESDQLVTALGEVPVKVAASKPGRGRNYRALAWAASIVLAVGLGFAGRSMLQERNVANSLGESGRLGQKAAPVGDTPAPVAVTPPPVSEERASPSASGGGVAPGTVSSADGQRSRDAQDPAAPPDQPIARETERRPAVAQDLSVDSINPRRQLAGDLAEAPTQGFREGAAGTVTPAEADKARRDSTAGQDDQRQPEAGRTEVPALALRARASKDVAAQSQSAPAMLQPRDEANSYALKPPGAPVISMEEAVRVLGGSIRLVDSLTPVRLELEGADSTIRIVYVTAGVEVWLDQQRDRGIAGFRRYQPEGAARKLNTSINTLNWNDLRGFYLTLTGPLPTSVLEQIKARIR
ncbi:MAG: zf-HC2 domain-containing protein [Gemmatimonadota bacterium]